MNQLNARSKMVPVLLAALVVVVLAGSLGARIVSRGQGIDVPAAPEAMVPQPIAWNVAELEVPCWSCPSAEEWSLRFRTDLDLLAPLGTGSANAAEFFGLFAKVGGSRGSEAVAATKRGVDGPDWLGVVLPPDDPLLLEAEPWVDQATMAFYSGVFELEGYSTRITNLLFALKLSRSWIARGVAEEDSGAAMDDFRRAIRLGRLLRQEDAVIISDLVGLACIHLGTRAVYERALEDGDLETALLASVILGEVPAQRLGTKQRLTSTDLMAGVWLGDNGGLNFRLAQGKLDRVIDIARSAPDRRFRCEAILGLNLVLSLGSTADAERALAVLDELAAAGDPVVADAAAWSRVNLPDMEQLKEWAVPVNQ